MSGRRPRVKTSDFLSENLSSNLGDRIGSCGLTAMISPCHGEGGGSIPPKTEGVL